MCGTTITCVLALFDDNEISNNNNNNNNVNNVNNVRISIPL